MAAEGSTGPPADPWCAPANRPALDSTNPPSEAVLTDIDALVSANIGLIVGGLVVVVLALAFAVVGLIRRVRGLGRRLESLTQGSDESSLEAVLGSHLERVRQVVTDVGAVAARTAVVERDLQRSFGRIGLVRFNPFEDTGAVHAALAAHGAEKLDEDFAAEGVRMRIRLPENRLDALKAQLRDATRDRVRLRAEDADTP